MSVSVVVECPPMAEQQPQPDESSTTSARVDKELLRKARIICAHSPGRNGRTLKITDYFDRLLRRPIERDYAEIMRRLREAEDQEEQGQT